MTELIFEEDEFEYQYNDLLQVNLRKGIDVLKHQQKTLDFMDYRSRSKIISGGIIALKMGLGKTCISLFRIALKCLRKKELIKLPMLTKKINKYMIKIIQQYSVDTTHPFLVVLPKSAISVWKQEIEKFVGDQLRYLIFHRETMKNKFNTITYKELCKYHIVITTYQTLSKIAKKNNIFESLLEKDSFMRNAGINAPIYTKKIGNTLYKLKGPKILFYTLWEEIFADESHKLANPKSLTFYTMMSLHAKHKWCLTGSLINNYTTDLFTQIKWLGGCEDISNPKQFTYEEYLRKELYKCILIMSYADAGIKLPPIIRKVEILELSDKEEQLYNYYQTETRNAYNNFVVGGNNFASVLTMFLRLRQVCICPYTILEKSSRNYIEKKDEKYNIAQKVLDKVNNGLVSWINDIKGTAGMYSTKINRMIDIIKKEIPKDESVVVFTNFKKVVDVVVKRFKKEKITYTLFDGDVKSAGREKSIEKFRKKNAQVFLATFKAGSESLNLSDISNNVITCELWYNPTTEDQAECRVHRYGQVNIVKVWKLMVKNSIDEKIEQICKDKRLLAELFMSKKQKVNEKLNAKLIGQILSC